MLNFSFKLVTAPETEPFLYDFELKHINVSGCLQQCRVIKDNIKAAGNPHFLRGCLQSRCAERVYGFTFFHSHLKSGLAAHGPEHDGFQGRPTLFTLKLLYRGMIWGPAPIAATCHNKTSYWTWLRLANLFFLQSSKQCTLRQMRRGSELGKKIERLAGKHAG